MLTTSPAARTALVYVTAGSLILIWTVVWFVWMWNYPPGGAGQYYVMGGFFATGLIIVLIGLGVGRLGNSARHADNPAIVMTPNVTPTMPAAVIAPPPISNGTEAVVPAAPAVVPR